VSYNGHKRPAYLDMPFMPERGHYAEQTALKIDAEVARLIAEAQETARRVLRERRGAMDRISARLLEKEVVEADELKTLLEEGTVDG
jgi:cell division protease FtsH